MTGRRQRDTRWLQVTAIARAILPLIAVFLTQILVQSQAENPAGTLDFHRIAAQVLPVLLLVLVLEARFFELHAAPTRMDILLALVTLAVLAYGEFQALRVVLTGQSGSGDWVAAALAGAFVGIATIALSSTGRTEHNKEG